MFSHTISVTSPLENPKNTEETFGLRLLTIKTKYLENDQKKKGLLAQMTQNTAVCVSNQIAREIGKYVKSEKIDVGIFTGKGERFIHVKPNTNGTPNVSHKYLKKNFCSPVEMVKSAKNAGYDNIIVCFSSDDHIPNTMGELKEVLDTVQSDKMVSHVLFTQEFVEQVNSILPYNISAIPVDGNTPSFVPGSSHAFQRVMKEVWKDYLQPRVKIVTTSTRVPTEARVCQVLYGECNNKKLGISTVTLGRTLLNESVQMDGQILAVHSPSGSTHTVRVGNGMIEITLPHQNAVHRILLWEKGESVTNGIEIANLDEPTEGLVDKVDLKEVIKVMVLPQCDTVSWTSDVYTNTEPHQKVNLVSLEDSVNYAYDVYATIESIHDRIKEKDKDEHRLNDWIDIIQDVGKVDAMVRRLGVLVDKAGIAASAINKIFGLLPVCTKKVMPTNVMRQSSIPPLSCFNYSDGFGDDTV